MTQKQDYSQKKVKLKIKKKKINKKKLLLNCKFSNCFVWEDSNQEKREKMAFHKNGRARYRKCDQFFQAWNNFGLKIKKIKKKKLKKIKKKKLK